MRNLKLLEALKILGRELKSGDSFTSIDYDNKVVYFSSETGIHGIDPLSKQVQNEVDLTKEGYVTEDGATRIIGLQHLSDMFSVCAATSGGELILWDVNTGEVEGVGSVESGFTAMSWSPDGELLVLATGAGTMIIMTRDFDPLLETSLHPGEFGEAQQVNVGWGKKETQFHGSEGKQAAKVTAANVAPAAPWDSQQPRISWRGDGQYFVISTVSSDTGARKLRVWTREGGLHSTSEAANGLEQALAWKPSGSVIATSLRRPNKHTISFFELNGLMHGEFILKFDTQQTIVKDLLWNNDSSVLCVWCEDLNKTGDSDFKPKSYVQLWTAGNYHWYLKQSLEFGSGDGRVASVSWDPEHAYHLHVLSQAGTYLRYVWAWDTCCSRGRSADDQALVAVIDGNKALMTPFRSMAVPPPMCAFHIENSCNISDVVFSPLGNDFAVIGSNDKLTMYSYNEAADKECAPAKDVKMVAAGGPGFGIRCAVPATSVTFKFPDAMFPRYYSHVTFVSATRLVFCSPCPSGEDSVLHLAELQAENNTVEITHTTDIPGVVIAVSFVKPLSYVVLQLSDGTLLKYNPEEPDIAFPLEDENEKEVQMPFRCPQMQIANIGGIEAVIGLTTAYRLYVNGIEVASNCTSFAVHDDYLLLTTLSHTIRCISLSTKLEKLPMLNDGKEHPFDESVRRVERGSRIVTVVRDDTKLVLQMPRGNLETIHPRALILSAVRKHLDNLNFFTAFDIMRKHRINMNLIYDHNPSVMLSNTGAFIEQVSQVNHISLFLTDLQEEDVTATMYTAAYDRSTSPAAAANSKSSKSKVDTVCDALRKGLEEADHDKYMLSILTAHVKKTTPELDTALNCVKDLKNKEKNGYKGSVSAEESLKYLLFLVDVNELYDVALGTYDFDLVLMVAEKSQKDPKEYLPFLNNLRKMEHNYQMYTIDLHLRRFTKALQHISKCGNEHFDECLDLTKKQKLFKEALALFDPKSCEYRDISLSYGEYLNDKKAFEEAGIVFFKAEENEQALNAFESAVNWRQAMVVASKLKYPTDKQEELARRMAKKLADQRKHVEAACLLEQYASDVEESIVVLIEGAQWEEALRLMYRHDRTDFIESDLKTAILDSCTQFETLIEDTQAQFVKYKTRLVVVRENKERERLEFLEGGGKNEADADLFSDTSSATGDGSIISGSSKYSSTSSQRSNYSKSSGSSRKSRRKTERKKWSLREGSAFEDFALIEASAKIYKQSEEWREDIHSLMKVMTLFHYDQLAGQLQGRFAELLALLESGVSSIWDAELQQDGGAAPLTGPDTTANVIAAAIQQGQRIKQDVQLDPHLRIPPNMKTAKSWKLQLV